MAVTTCDKCGWTINKFGPKNLLKHKFYNHTENATSDYLCESCGKYFFQSLDLLKHSREEHGDGSNIGKSNFQFKFLPLEGNYVKVSC